jgi:phospholipase C
LDTKDARESPVGLGYRVPMVIASPWSRGGWVNSQVFNITSTLQFLEKFLSKKTGKEIREPNISDWRRMITGDLTSVFRPYNGEKIKLPAFVKKDPFIEKINNAKYKKQPSGYKTLTDLEIEQVRSNPLQSSLLPKQESGIRDSCALPYQLSVNGKLSADKKHFEIAFAAGNDIFGTNQQERLSVFTRRRNTQ